MAGELLTPLDATFLEFEQADPSAHMHIGALMVFDPRPARCDADLGGAARTRGPAGSTRFRGSAGACRDGASAACSGRRGRSTSSSTSTST